MANFRRLMPLLFSIFIGLLGAILLDLNSYKDISSTITTFCGFVVAAVVPASILSATLLRSGGLSLEEVKNYRLQISDQITYLFSILFVALFLLLLIIFAQLINWVDIRLFYINEEKNIVVTSSTFFNFLISFSVCFLVLRMWGLFIAIKSMFRFHANVVEREVAGKLEVENKKALDASISLENLPKDTRNNFGKLLDEDIK